ncbi:hypothetical protein ACFQ0B_16450 [Nonomuraea thailandensis]
MLARFMAAVSSATRAGSRVPSASRSSSMTAYSSSAHPVAARECRSPEPCGNEPSAFWVPSMNRSAASRRPRRAASRRYGFHGRSAV